MRSAPFALIPQTPGRAHRRCARAFTLIDVLVSMAVIAVLISLLLPSIGPVKETARQVACRTGIRQIGIGIAMFADDHQDRIPVSSWYKKNQPAQTVLLNYSPEGPAQSKVFSWDGMGILYAEQYLTTPGIFYCPSHRSHHKLADQVDQWRANDALIVGNYQYRSSGPNKKEFLSEIEPKRAALVSDSLRSREEYNHQVGANVLRADLSVYWFNDRDQKVYNRLAESDGSGTSYTGLNAIGSIWNDFDKD